MRRLLILLAAFAAAGCGNREILPWVGKWDGGFVAADDHSMRGYLQIYATKNRFAMRIEGAQETVETRGGWTLEGDRLKLKMTSVKIDDMGGEAQRDPKKPFIDPDAIRAAYSRELVLDMQPDKTTLVGQKMSFGKVAGEHRFTKSVGSERGR